MSNKNWHRLNFSNDIRTDTHHLWQCSSNINSTLQLHLGDIMNKQRFSAAAFIKKKWLKWRTPLASGGLMTPRYLLLFAMAEGTSLSYRSGFLLAPDEESSITGHSQTVRSYSAPSRGKWKRRGPRVPASTTGTGGSTRWHLAWWCWWCPLVCVCVRDELTCVMRHSLLAVKLPSLHALYSAPSLNSPSRDRQDTYLHNALLQWN